MECYAVHTLYDRWYSWLLQSLQQQLHIHSVYLLQWLGRFEPITNVGFYILIFMSYEITMRHITAAKMHSCCYSHCMNHHDSCTHISDCCGSYQHSNCTGDCIVYAQYWSDKKTWQNTLPLFEVVTANGIWCVVCDIVPSINHCQLVIATTRLHWAQQARHYKVDKIWWIARTYWS